MVSKKDSIQIKAAVNSTHYFKAINQIDSLTALYPDNEDCPDLLYLQHDKARAMEYAFQFNESYNLFNDLLNQIRGKKLFELEAKIYISIARIHDNLKRKIDLERNLENAKSLIDQYELDHLLAEWYVRKASYERFYGKIEEALKYANIALEYGLKYNPISKEVADSYFLIGSLSKDSDIRIDHLYKSIMLFLEFKDYMGAGFMYSNIARIYQDLSEYNKALDLCHKAIESIEQVDQKHNDYYAFKEILLEDIAYIHKDMGQQDSAFHYIRLSKEIHDKYDYQVDQNQISQMEIDLAIQAEKQKSQYLKSRSRLLILTLILFIALTGLMTILYFNNRRKNHLISIQNNIIQDQVKELDKGFKSQSILLSEIHHRVKNNLQLLISLLTLKTNVLEGKETKHFIEDIINKIRSISLIHEELYQSKSFDKINVLDYFEKLTTHFKSLSNQLNISVDIDESIELNIETVLPLGILLSETLINSIKYGKPNQGAPLVTISLIERASDYELVYRDNGNGIKSDKEGLGTMIIKSMIRQLNGSFKITNSNGYELRLNFIDKEISKI